MAHLSSELESQMQDMQSMFEDKFRELKSKNRVLFDRAVASHFKYLNEVQLDDISEVETPLLEKTKLNKLINDNAKQQKRSSSKPLVDHRMLFKSRSELQLLKLPNSVEQLKAKVSEL